MIEVEIVKDSFEGPQGEGAVLGNRPSFWVVGPSTGIFQIEDFVTQGAKAK
jgi:hypothetical protein